MDRLGHPYRLWHHRPLWVPRGPVANAGPPGAGRRGFGVVEPNVRIRWQLVLIVYQRREYTDHHGFLRDVPGAGKDILPSRGRSEIKQFQKLR